MSEIFSTKQMLIDAAAAELGCSEDELGAFGGVADIPRSLHAAQQWAGFLQGSQPAPQGKPLIRVQLPLVYARDWTIQFATPVVPSPNLANVGLPSTITARVLLNWGHHGSVDSVELDWPSRGGSVTIHGSYIGLSVVDPGTNIGGGVFALTANYNAWLSEGSGARANPWMFQPVRTSQRASLAATGVVIFPAPPRARAFYVSSQVAAGPILPFTVMLLDNAVVRMTFEVEGSNSAAPVPRLATQIQQPFVLPPFCNAVSITNTTGAVMDDVEIHWLIDVGS